MYRLYIQRKSLNKEIRLQKLESLMKTKQTSNQCFNIIIGIIYQPDDLSSRHSSLKTDCFLPEQIFAPLLQTIQQALRRTAYNSKNV